LNIGSHEVPLTVRPNLGITLSDVEGFPPFKDWVATIDHEMRTSPAASRVRISSVEVTDADKFGNGKLGFVKFKADVHWTDKDGGRIPGVVFLRGGAVAILLIVRPNDVQDDTDERVVLCVQPRIPVGSLSTCELPAGMLDGENHFAGIAARELEEECGIHIDDGDLIDLVKLAVGNDNDTLGGNGVYPSPGGSDEYLKLFLCRKSMPMKEIQRLEDHEGGLRDEGERIQVKLVKLKDLWRSTRDMKALSALALYDR
ncbi:NUDIX hydrolase domain-like protein, partial [Gaertneriomyces semiglobifer]